MDELFILSNDIRDLMIEHFKRLSLRFDNPEQAGDHAIGAHVILAIGMVSPRVIILRSRVLRIHKVILQYSLKVIVLLLLLLALGMAVLGLVGFFVLFDLCIIWKCTLVFLAIILFHCLIIQSLRSKSLVY